MNKRKIIMVILMLLILIVIICIAIYLQKINKTKEEENLPIEELNEGGEPYNDAQLDNFDIKIEGMKSEIKKEIKNMNTFELEFKKFIYLNGLVDADVATITSYDLNDNELTIKFQLNNPNRTQITGIVDLSEQEYKFSEEA